MTIDKIDILIIPYTFHRKSYVSYQFRMAYSFQMILLVSSLTFMHLGLVFIVFLELKVFIPLKSLFSIIRFTHVFIYLYFLRDGIPKYQNIHHLKIPYEI